MPKHVQTGTVHMGIYGEGEVATGGQGTQAVGPPA